MTRLFSVPLVVHSFCPQESGTGAHCLSMESSPIWARLSTYSLYQAPGSCCSPREQFIFKNLHSKKYQLWRNLYERYNWDLERSNSRSLIFWSLISCKGAELGHMLLLNIDSKAYMGSPTTSSHITLSDLERSNSRSHRFWSLISCKRARPYVTMK